VRFSKEIKVGIFAIGTITMFYLGFNYLKGIDFFSRTNRYFVIYQDVGGLTKSNPVTISGFNIGRVGDIKLLQDNGNIVLVALDIDRDVILGDSSVARLDANFLGDVSIVVNVGDITHPIEPLDTLFSRVDPGLTDLIMQSTQPITKNLPATLGNLNLLLEDLQGSGESLKKALKSFTYTSNRLNRTLRDSQDDIKETVTEFKRLSLKLNESIDEARPLITKFNTLADSLNDIRFSVTINKLNKLLDTAEGTIGLLDNRESSLGKLMYEDSLYQNLNKTMLDLDSLLLHMNNNPKHFFSPLGKSKKKIEKDLANQK